MKISRWLLLLSVSALLATAQSSAPRKAPAKAQASATAATATPLDINTASVDDLNALAGIGPVLAQKIVAGRPYRSKTELDTKKIIPHATYEKIKGQIVAHHSK